MSKDDRLIIPELQEKLKKRITGILRSIIFIGKQLNDVKKDPSMG